MDIQQDLLWMQHALESARLAQAQGEVPIGACIILDNKCISTGFR